ncbi:MAG: deoxyribose-phosphate aldolase [Chitinophagales bacterium]|nr:deoxyribose-phosphate aldolase [Chitinophagales bacterium]
METKDIASKIDHTLLKPDTTTEKIKILCSEAVENNFVAVCVPPYFVSIVKEFLSGSKVKLATVIGFPLGYNNSLIKVEEAKRAMEDGADELDVVINLAAFFSGNEKTLFHEIESITQIAHLKSKQVKWIIETALLNEKQIKQCCELAVKAEVDFVKTSTGFNGGGATVEVIELLRKLLPPQIKIKASGGIKTREQAIAIINAGADRIGTSSSLTIIGK